MNLIEAFKNSEKSLQYNLKSTEFPYHPVAKGDVAEDTWRTLLEKVLPSRFSVGTGFVIDAHNQVSGQIDCIIYDNVYTPTFWGDKDYRFVPVESVHAVFEIKQKISLTYLREASKKIESVRALHRTSTSYRASGNVEAPKPLIHIIGGILATKFNYKHGPNSKHFLKTIENILNQDTQKNIDIILSACHGYADYFDTGFPTAQPKIDTGEGSAFRGIFRLIQALLQQGTVGAIDLNYYQIHSLGKKNK